MTTVPMTEPWYRRTHRWGQTNLTEIDPERYDDAWWRRHWRETAVQGVIINAGGIVAYYPSRFPLHHRARTLGDRDLYGEIVASARDEGLTVVARMDSNRVAEDFFAAHPDWVCRDVAGEPIRAADKYVTCINSPYYREYLPEVLTEIIERSRPDGFADNSWAGLPRSSICHCDHCAAGFRRDAGTDLPRDHDWSAPAYRAWIDWNYRLRTALWELNNRVAAAAGGPDCRWFGMLSGDVLNSSQRFVDLRQILSRSELIMLDHQHRNAVDGFEQNTEAGKRLHELLGWDKLIPESTPQYQLGRPAFRVAAMPQAEVRCWATAGFAGGIQPWWHHIGACHDDRRQYRTAAPLFGWHRDNLDVLIDRTPVADLGIVWSQRNHDLAGQDRAAERTLDPYRGVTRALNGAGLTSLPIPAEDLDRAAGRFAALVLPNLVVLSDDQLAAITRYVEQGGSVIATGDTGRLDENGRERADSGLAELFGIRTGTGIQGDLGSADPSIETHARHTYLRLTPELRGSVEGPVDPAAPVPAGQRHPVLAGLDETDLIPFGGLLREHRVDQGTQVLATFVPDFPIFPPETSWMRTPSTDLPGIVVRETPAGGRLVWLLADLDRCYARDQQPDHALIIGNAARWAVAEPTLIIDGDGRVNANLYRQQDRLVLHLTNRTVTATVPGRQDRLVPAGPVTVRLRTPGRPSATATLRVRGGEVPVAADGDLLTFTVPEVLDHEVVTLPL
ncbi:beta-galactosidase trimerization domain-containing protein [Microlunatus sp. GCM10028923]|uniref:beta-galactosidase trimerization domain-containing protein n=1 Tax=Microlunatus sp. GCM10028923 TaxID=3273400 RepID=UPI0036062D64